MCAVFGIFGDSPKDMVERMGLTMKHRGPDDSNIISSDNICLGFNRLAIVDIKSGMQPVSYGDIVSVMNGEIYNYIELRRELELDGFKFKSDHSDSELVPALYVKYGLDFINKVNGMFAIAIYDASKQELYLIRDRVGKKPLYYTKTPEFIAFASEIKALKMLDAKFCINQKSIYSYLCKKNTTAPHTIYNEIFQVMPAEILTFDSEFNIKKTLYWNIDFCDRLENNNYDENYYSDKLISIIEDSVKIRTRTDVEFGSYLSGGVDSSLVASILAINSSAKLKTFTLGYKDDIVGKNSDIVYASKMANILNTEHYEYIIDSRDVFDELKNVLSSFDEPFCGTISTFFLTKFISRHIRVAFSGDGADELFGSYFTHRISTPIQYLKNNPHIKTLEDLSNSDKKVLTPEFCTQEGFARLQSVYENSNTKWRQKLFVFTQDELDILFNERIIMSDMLLDVPSVNKSELNVTLESEFKDQLPNQILPFVDRLSMAHSVEVRCPFLDFNLVEFVSTMPSELKINNGVNKYILKKAAAKYLPQDLLDRPKEGFVLPFYKWIENEYFTEVKDTILNSSIIKDFSMNEIFINKILRDLQHQKQGHLKVWSLYNLALWYDNNK